MTEAIVTMMEFVNVGGRERVRGFDQSADVSGDAHHTWTECNCTTVWISGHGAVM